MAHSRIARITSGAGSALQVLALMGAGIAASTMLAAPAMAQDFTNVTATGRVVGTDGNGINGATVTVTSNDEGFTRSVTTGNGGTYRVPSLPTGNYTFAITADGYESFTDPDIRLTPDRTGNQFALVSVNANDTGAIVVQAGRLEVADFERNTTGAVIDIGDLAQRVPVARDLTSVIQLAPGTTTGDAGFGNLPNIAGSSVSENQFFVNGLNITNFRNGLGSTTVPFEFYESIEIKNGGYPAEFGRSTGGFVNAITKSGSNEYHAGVLVNFSPNGLRADERDTIFSENSHEYDQRIDASFFLSGPIIKDRLFIYGLYQTRYTETTNTVLGYRRQCNDGTQTCDTDLLPNGAPNLATSRTSDDFETFGTRFDRSKTTSPFYAVKVDAVPIDGQRLEFTYFDTSGTTQIDSYGYNAFNTNNAAFPFLGSGRDGQLGQGAFQGTEVDGYGGENYVGRYTGTFTNWLTVSAAYGKNKDKETAGSSRDDFPFILDNRDRSRPGNATQIIEQNFDTREFYRADVDLYFNLFGTHHVRFGYDRENLTTDSTTSYTGGVAYQYFNSGATGDAFVPTPNTNYVTSRTFVNGGVFDTKNEAYYIQDNWSLFGDRLNLNLGLRNDRFENKNVDGDTYYSSGDNFSPRVGASFDVLGDGLTKLYGSFSRYYLPIAANTNIRLAGAELDFTKVNLLNGVNADGTPIIGAPVLDGENNTPCPDTGTANCDVNGDGTATSTVATIAQNLTAQSLDEYILGLEHNFGGGIRASIYFTHRNLNDSLEDSAIDAAVNQFCQDNGIGVDPNRSDFDECSDIYFGFNQYVLNNPGKGGTITLQGCPTRRNRRADNKLYSRTTRLSCCKAPV